MGAIVRAPRRPGVVVDTGMCGRSLLGNREISFLEQHRPLGSINRMRLAVYLASLQVRQKLNMVAS